MVTLVKLINNLSSLGKKVKKYLPFFIGFKLITFTVLAYTQSLEIFLSPQNYKIIFISIE